MKSEDVKRDLNKLKNTEKADVYSWFFKTGKGQYGEGDKFLGITVPEQRKVAKKYIDISLVEIKKLLESKIHEHRFTALEILVMKFKKSKELDKKKIVDFYLKNTRYINNWDLVDTSASYILGDYLYKKSKSILYKLAKSKNLWERRISIISTHYFIRKGEFTDTLKISETLLNDNHDLIHKAVGWMLREVGKRDKQTLLLFLDKYSLKMPRTALRYSIEHFSPEERKFYLRK